MSLKISINSSTFEPAPAGVHDSVINLIVDCGKQHSQLYGDKQQVLIGCVLTNCPMPNGKPYQIHQRYGASMHSKSELRQFVEGIIGQALPTTNGSQFDVSTLLGKACKVLVQHKKNAAGQTIAIIKAAMPPDPHQTMQTDSPLLCYDGDAPDPRVLSQLAPWIQDVVASAVPDQKLDLTQAETSTETTNPFAEDWDRTLPVDWSSLCNNNY